jgi:nitrate/nitrite transport system ATP-binding protein
MNERFLELTRLGKTYATPNGPAVIVKDFDLHVHEGEFVCVIGHSGCGKSTVLSIVMGLNDATEGGVILAGREVVGPGTDRGVVFQSPALLPWLTARGNVLLAVEQVNGRHGRAERRKLADHYLALVGLAEVADRYPDELSAGMRQRVGHRPGLCPGAEGVAPGRAVQPPRRAHSHGAAGRADAALGGRSQDCADGHSRCR